VTPTLVACNIAPFFEVIEALNSDGTLNDDAQLDDTYDQLELSVSQSSFPSPRGNIDEVNVLEETVRGFFNFGGALVELSREQAFLTSYLESVNYTPIVSTQPWVRGSDPEGVEPAGGYDIDGRTLILHVDSHTALPPTSGALPTSENITVTFAAAIAGGNLTLDEVVAQINAVYPELASKHESSPSDWVLQLTSTAFGAGASIVVRQDGTANWGTDRLGFDPADDIIAVGSGFYADDDSDGDNTSPRLKVYEGNLQGTVGLLGSQQVTAPDFNNASIEIGDSVVADGVLIGDIEAVESDQLTMEVEQNIQSHDNPFAPMRVWIRANNLSYPAPAASEAATLTGLIQTADESAAWIVGDSAFVGTASPSESIDMNVVVDGVAQATETVSSLTGDWTTLPLTVASINGQATLYEAYEANAQGDEVPATLGTHLGLRTIATNKGSAASLTMVSSTVAADLGFTPASLPVGDVGENIRYLEGTPADGTSGAVSAAPVTTTTVSQTVIVITNIGTETITWAGDVTLAAVIADWNSKALYTEAYEANAAGVQTTAGGYFAIRTIGENVGVTATLTNNTGTDTTTLPAVFAAAGTDVDLNGTTFKWSIDGNPHVYQATFVTDEDQTGPGSAPGGVSLQQVLDKINELTPGVAAASSDSPPFLELTSNKVGEASRLLIGDGTANPLLGFSDLQADVGNGRPAPDLAIDITGSAIIQGQLLRDGLTGLPFDPGFAPILLAYKGLRLDLSPEADNPSLLVVDDTDILGEAAPPISTDNPGSLMTFLTLINAPSVSAAAIGVPEVSADAPDGTPLGYARCFEFLQNEEVYALTTASHIPTVHQTGLTHVNSMSEPENKGERIYFFNPEIPDRANPSILGSGTDANSTATTNEVTVEVNLAPALIAAGIDPNLDINPATGEILNEVYFDRGGDDNIYLVQRVDAGTTVTLRTTFASGDGNDDSFYTDEDLPSGVISDDWSVSIRGEQLLITGTTRPDYNAIAETIQGAAQAYGFRRGYYVHPDQVGINTTGLEQVVPGWYATACIAGMVAEQPPQQGFTNFPITGLTRVVGSGDVFTQSQLNVIAAGGVYILVQDVQGAPVICRHQLSTDSTSIETRELSITKAVDFTAKFLRGGLRNFIGRSNITQPFLDNLSTVVQGQLNFLTDTGVLIGAEINNIIQDADNPDTVLIDVTLDVPFPCNYIRLTLVI
jgi:hypothetical protein